MTDLLCYNLYGAFSSRGLCSGVVSLFLPAKILADIDVKVLIAVNDVQYMVVYEVFVQTLITMQFSWCKRIYHLLTYSSSVEKSVWRSFLMWRYRRQSSANSLVSDVFTTSGRSLMKARNTKTVRWGTLESTSFWVDFNLLRLHVLAEIGHSGILCSK